jgi:hypothetical protein
MSSIGGPGGVGGPKPPGGVDPAGTPDGARAPNPTERSPAVMDQLAAELAAGRLSPHEAIERMIEEIALDGSLGEAERSELRELLTDLVAHDPHLAALANRVA